MAGTTTPLLSFRSDFNTIGDYGMVRFGDQSQTTAYQKGAIIYESVASSARGKFHIALENTDTSASVALTDARLTILSDGNVGIGTTGPGTKLHLEYATPSPTASTINSAELRNLGLYIGDSSLDNVVGEITSGIAFGYLTESNTGIFGVDEGGTGAAGLGFVTGSNTAIAERVRITNTGNVGIGTTGPAGKFEVRELTNANLYNYFTARGGNGLISSLVFRTLTGAGAAIGGSIGHDGTTNTLFFAGDSGGGVTTKHMVINSTGNVGIGTTGPSSYLAGVPGLAIYSTSYAGVSVANSGKFWLQWINGNDLRFYESGAGLDRVTIQAGGNVGIGLTAPTYQLQLSTNSAGKPTSNTWTIVSDRRIKKDIEPFTDGLDILTKINPVSYKLNGKAGTPENATGISIIAQDVKDIIPYAISTYKAKLEPVDTQETELYNFDSSSLTFVTINAIKEQQKQIEDLKAELDELKAQFNLKQ